MATATTTTATSPGTRFSCEALFIGRKSLTRLLDDAGAFAAIVELKAESASNSNNSRSSNSSSNLKVSDEEDDEARCLLKVGDRSVQVAFSVRRDEGFHSDGESPGGSSTHLTAENHTPKQLNSSSGNSSGGKGAGADPGVSSSTASSAGSSISSDCEDSPAKSTRFDHVETFSIQDVLSRRFNSYVVWTVRSDARGLEVMVFKCLKGSQEAVDLSSCFSEVSRKTKFHDVRRRKKVQLPDGTASTAAVSAVSPAGPGPAPRGHHPPFEGRVPGGPGDAPAPTAVEALFAAGRKGLTREDAAADDVEDDVDATGATGPAAVWNLIQHTDRNGVTHLEVASVAAASRKAQFAKELEKVLLKELEVRKGGQVQPESDQARYDAKGKGCVNTTTTTTTTGRDLFSGLIPRPRVLLLQHSTPSKRATTTTSSNRQLETKEAAGSSRPKHSNRSSSSSSSPRDHVVVPSSPIIVPKSETPLHGADGGSSSGPRQSRGKACKAQPPSDQVLLVPTKTGLEPIRRPQPSSSSLSSSSSATISAPAAAGTAGSSSGTATSAASAVFPNFQLGYIPSTPASPYFMAQPFIMQQQHQVPSYTSLPPPQALVYGVAWPVAYMGPSTAEFDASLTFGGPGSLLVLHPGQQQQQHQQQQQQQQQQDLGLRDHARGRPPPRAIDGRPSLPRRALSQGRSPNMKLGLPGDFFGSGDLLHDSTSGGGGALSLTKRISDAVKSVVGSSRRVSTGVVIKGAGGATGPPAPPQQVLPAVLKSSMKKLPEDPPKLQVGSQGHHQQQQQQQPEHEDGESLLTSEATWSDVRSSQDSGSNASGAVAKDEHRKVHFHKYATVQMVG